MIAQLQDGALVKDPRALQLPLHVISGHQHDRARDCGEPGTIQGSGFAHQHGRPVLSVRARERALCASLLVELLLLVVSTREMDGDVGGDLDRLGQNLNDLAEDLLLFGGRQHDVG